MLTAELTRQIRALRDDMYDRIAAQLATKDDRETHAICTSALNEMCEPSRRREAIGRLGEILNARATKEGR